MYAVIKTGGKQYRVNEGETLRVEKIEAEQGTSLNFGEVLMISDGEQTTVGTPHVEGGKVTATVMAQGRAPKVEIVKFKRRKYYQKRMGHRQSYTEVRITNISSAGLSLNK